jgi:hypothetical protein
MQFEFQHNASIKPWRWMLAVDCVIPVGGILFTLFVDSPRYAGYMHLLVTYHFGFARRALLGTIISSFTNVVPLWYVYAIAIAAWLVTLILFLAVFRKVFGFNAKNFPLFVFFIDSPFFFKNFAIALGHFDIYGCLWALVALLIPAGSLYPLLIAGGCVALVLMHHIHFFLYVPTIGFVVCVRYGLLQSFSTRKVIYCLCLAILVSTVFAAAALFGRMPVPRDTFLAYVRARASDPIDSANAWMWYSTIGQEIGSTWSRIGFYSSRLPVYAALVCLHFPLVRYCKYMLDKLPTPFFRNASIGALAAISVAYLPIFVVVHDYSRWVSSWAVCMFLAMHAVRLLPSTATGQDPPIRPDTKLNLALGWIVTAIPRVGVTIPF